MPRGYNTKGRPNGHFNHVDPWSFVSSLLFTCRLVLVVHKQLFVLLKAFVSNAMLTLGLIVVFWQQEGSHLIGKVHLILNFFLLSIRVFPPYLQEPHWMFYMKILSICFNAYKI